MTSSRLELLPAGVDDLVAKYVNRFTYTVESKNHVDEKWKSKTIDKDDYAMSLSGLTGAVGATGPSSFGSSLESFIVVTISMNDSFKQEFRIKYIPGQAVKESIENLRNAVNTGKSGRFSIYTNPVYVQNPYPILRIDIDDHISFNDYMIQVPLYMKPMLLEICDLLEKVCA